MFYFSDEYLKNIANFSWTLNSSQQEPIKILFEASLNSAFRSSAAFCLTYDHKVGK